MLILWRKHDQVKGDIKLTNVVQVTMIYVSCDDAMMANEVTKH